jgi:hypothetical protein
MKVTETHLTGLDPAIITLTDKVYRIDIQTGLVGFVGMSYVDLLSRTAYFWFVPGPALPHANIQALRREWAKHTIWHNAVIAVNMRDRTAQRFAALFGFENTGLLYDKEHYLYGISSIRSPAVRNRRNRCHDSVSSSGDRVGSSGPDRGHERGSVG